MKNESDFSFLRAIDDQGGSIRIGKADFVSVISELIRRQIKVGGRNLLLNSEQERTGYRFLSIPVRDVLHSYINQEIVVSFDMKADVSREMQIYPYQYSGISVNETFQFIPLTEYQRFSFCMSVHDYGIIPNLTSGDIAIYDYNGENQLYIKRIKIELGNIPTDWTPAVEEMVNG